MEMGPVVFEGAALPKQSSNLLGRMARVQVRVMNYQDEHEPSR
jgi:hypothetical protein